MVRHVTAHFTTVEMKHIFHFNLTELYTIIKYHEMCILSRLVW